MHVLPDPSPWLLFAAGHKHVDVGLENLRHTFGSQSYSVSECVSCAGEEHHLSEGSPSVANPCMAQGIATGAFPLVDAGCHPSRQKPAQGLWKHRRPRHGVHGFVFDGAWLEPGAQQPCVWPHLIHLSHMRHSCGHHRGAQTIKQFLFHGK